MLAVRSYGTGPPVVALHGFTHTGAQFEGLAGLIPRRIVAPDLPGHGQSSDIGTGLDTVIASIAEVIEAIGSGPLPVIGYSQGGRLALQLALDRPRTVQSLVVISAGAGIEDDEERAARATADADLAESIRSEGTEAFLSSWTTSGMTSTTHLDLTVRSRDLAIRRQNTAEGLARALTGYGQGAQPSLWSSLPKLDMPCLLIAGDRDGKIRVTTSAMAEALPDARKRVIRSSGHNPLLDQPEALAEEISAFLHRQS